MNKFCNRDTYVFLLDNKSFFDSFDAFLDSKEQRATILVSGAETNIAADIWSILRREYALEIQYQQKQVGIEFIFERKPSA